MSKAVIQNGIWIRKVTWENNGVWRTDIFKSVLADPRLKVAEFQLKAGPSVRILKEELKWVLVGGRDHYNGRIWGPFDIDPTAKTIAGQKVNMEVIPK
jgi:hypothetical protein